MLCLTPLLRSLLLGGLATGAALLPHTPAAAQTVSAPATPAASAPGAGLIRIGGSSTVYPILVEAIKAYRASGQQARIDLQESGTSDGLRRFCSGQLVIANASRPISARELKACESKNIRFIELPIAIDALSVVVHPANRWASVISTSELAKLWGRQAQGKITRWKDVNAAWPDRPISLCGPGKDSGSYDYFNKVINGQEDNSRQDYTASEDDNQLVSCVASQPNALGYFGFSYYQANASRLRAVAIRSASASVLPSTQSVQSGRYQPLSRPLFIYVNNQALGQRPEVQKFVSYLVRRGLTLVQRAMVIPLPSSTYQLVETKLFKRIPGTAFAGDLPVGLSLGEVLRRSLDQHKQPQFR
jgi:phosphate transport system substrate-binding protein